MKRISTHLDHNKRMQEFLRANGFPNAVPKYIDSGSLRGSWRIYSRPKREAGQRIEDIEYDRWSIEIADKLTTLGFTDLYGRPLGPYNGNGGMFAVFVRGHNEFLRGVTP